MNSRICNVKLALFGISSGLFQKQKKIILASKDGSEQITNDFIVVFQKRYPIIFNGATFNGNRFRHILFLF